MRQKSSAGTGRGNQRTSLSLRSQPVLGPARRTRRLTRSGIAASAKCNSHAAGRFTRLGGHYLWRKLHGEDARLHGHAGPVMAVACSSDGRLLASGSADRTIKLWSSTYGQELSTLKGHLRASIASSLQRGQQAAGF